MIKWNENDALHQMELKTKRDMPTSFFRGRESVYSLNLFYSLKKKFRT